jgi:hypothetical protein
VAVRVAQVQVHRCGVVTERRRKTAEDS